MREVRLEQRRAMAKMRFLLILVLGLTGLAWPIRLGLPQPVLAQVGSGADPTLSSLQIAFWPEFDQPEVLVIYQGVFEEGTSLPVPVEFSIPARAGEPHAVAFFGEAGERFNQPYTTRLEGDQIVVSFELSALGFQLEYYDQLPVAEDGERSYSFTYTADYAVQSLNLEFQVPPTAEDFVLEPPADSVVEEADGLVYHLVQVGPLAAGQTETWTLSYQQDNADLTAPPAAEAAAPGPGSPSAPTEGGNTTIWIFLVAFVALIAVGAGAFWLGQRTEPTSGPPSRSPRAPSPERRKERIGGSGSRLQGGGGVPPPYCYRCGTPLRSDSDYCHKCGAPVRDA
jgi:hypothetical protein